MTKLDTQPASPTGIPNRDRAILLAREFAGNGRDRRDACVAALAAVPDTGFHRKMSPDQLKALAFGAVLTGFGRTD